MNIIINKILFIYEHFYFFFCINNKHGILYEKELKSELIMCLNLVCVYNTHTHS